MDSYFGTLDVLPCASAPQVQLENIALPYGGADGGDWTLGFTQESESGLGVNHERALGLAPTLQGVTILSSAVACLPMILERREGKNATTNTTLPGGKLMRNIANPLMCQGTFRQVLMNHALMEGNGLAYIQRDMRGSPVVPNGDPERAGIVPLIPTATWLEYDSDGKLWYITRLRDAGGLRRFKLAPRDVFHIKGLSHDGLWGYRLVDIARDVVGHGLALQRHSNRVFRNAARPSGILKFPSRLDPESRRNLRREWNELHEGLDNVARIALLQQGGEYQPISQTNHDAQVVELLEADSTLQASILNVPKHMVNVGTPPAMAVEELNLWFLQHSLYPWLCKWTEEARYKLLSRPDYEEEQLYFRFDLWQFLQTNQSAMFENLLKGTGGPFLKRSEARDMLPGQFEIDEEDEVYLSRSTGEIAGADGTEGTAGEEAAQADKMRNQVAKLMARETNRLAHAESNRIRKAAGESKDFLSFVDEFFGGEWKAKVAEVVSESVADAYCQLRRTELVNAFDRENLASVLDRDSREFEEHGRQLLNMEMGGSYGGNGSCH